MAILTELDRTGVKPMRSLSPASPASPASSRAKMGCTDPMADILINLGYWCSETYRQHGQICYVFELCPFSTDSSDRAQVVIRAGKFNNKFAEYCETGNTEDLL